MDNPEYMAGDRLLSAPPAISWPATRSALRKNAWTRWPLLLLGLLCGPLTVVLLSVFDQPEVHGIKRIGAVAAQMTGLIFVLGTMFGAVLVWINHRRRKAVRRYPWTSWQINYIATGRYEWVGLLDGNRQPVSTLVLSTWPKDLGKLVNHNTAEIWFAGVPTKYGVISKPGGGDLRYAYFSRSRQPPRFSFRENRAGPRFDPEGSSPQSVREFQLTPDHGRVMMKPVGEPAVVRHGGSQDTRYPSPRILRRVFAFVIDWSLHICGAAALVLLGKNSILLVGAVALGVWLAASFADRVILQGALHTTVGKALFGLCVIQPDDGSFPSYGRLTKVWFMNLYFSVVLPLALLGGDGPAPENLDDYFLPAVRRRDLRD